MKRTQRERGRRMSQMERFRRDPGRIDRSVHRWPANGWGGGRDRIKPRKVRWRYHRHGRWIGGLMQYEPGGKWFAYQHTAEGDGSKAEFWRRRDAKRWVEALN